MTPAGEVLQRRHPSADLQLPKTKNPAPEIFLWTRAAIWAAAVFAFLLLAPNPRAGIWDRRVTHDLGLFTDVWARWDSVFFLRIAEHGYETLTRSATAFFPLYPGAVGVLGRV